MSMSTNLHNTKRVWVMELRSTDDNALHFTDDKRNEVCIYLPPSVCAAIERAFTDATRALDETAAPGAMK